MPILNKDMSVCISLAGRPSNLGTRFHNFLYDELGLNFIYKAFTTDDIEGAVRGIRALGIRGCSRVDAVQGGGDPTRRRRRGVGGGDRVGEHDRERRRRAHGVEHRLRGDRDAASPSTTLDPAQRVLVRGSGGMAKAVVAAFRGAGFDDLTVVARNAEAGPALAGKYGYAWVAEDPEPEFDRDRERDPARHARGGCRGARVLAPLIQRASTVFDVVAFPAETPLVVAARAAGKLVISGAEVIALQAARQFERYTGVLALARAGRAGVGVLASRIARESRLPRRPRPRSRGLSARASSARSRAARGWR